MVSADAIFACPLLLARAVNGLLIGSDYAGGVFLIDAGLTHSERFANSGIHLASRASQGAVNSELQS